MAKKDQKNNSKENNKNKKSFFKGFKAELKKVTWLTPKQLANNTIAVIVIVLLTTLIVFALDLTFEAINEHGIEKIKETINVDNDTTENVVSEESEENSTSEQNSEENVTQNETSNNETNTEQQAENTSNE